MRVIRKGEGTQGSKEGGGSEQDKEGSGKRLPSWTRIIRGRTVTPPMGRRSGRLRRTSRRRRSDAATVLDSNGRRNGSSTARDGATAPRRPWTA